MMSDSTTASRAIVIKLSPTRILATDGDGGEFDGARESHDDGPGDLYLNDEGT